MNLSESFLTPAQTSRISGSTPATVTPGLPSAGHGSFATALANATKAPSSNPRSVGPAKRVNPGAGQFSAAHATGQTTDPRLAAALPPAVPRVPSVADVFAGAEARAFGSVPPFAATGATASPSLGSLAAENVQGAPGSLENLLEGSANGTGFSPSVPSNGLWNPGSVPAASSDANVFAGTLAGAGANSVGMTATHGVSVANSLESLLEELPIVGNVIRLFAASDANASKVAAAQASATGDGASFPETSTGTANGGNASSDASSLGTSSPAPSMTAAFSKWIVPELMNSNSVALPPAHASFANALPQATARPVSEATSRSATSSPAMPLISLNQDSQRQVSDERSALTQTLSARWQSELASASAKNTLNSGTADTGAQTSSGENGGTRSFANQTTQPVARVATGSANGGPSGAEAGATTNPTTTEAAAAAIAANSVPKTAPVSFASIASTASSAADSPQAAQWLTAMAPVTSPQASGSSNGNVPAAPAPSNLPAAPPALPGDAVTASSMVQRPDGSEMHVAMQTDLLGSIDLRATIHQSGLTATIGVQRADVQTLLANELPALQHALAEKSMQVAQISVLNNSVGGGASSRGDSQNSQQQTAKGTPASTMPFVREIHRVHASEIPSSLADAHGGFYGRGRLNVVA